MMHRRGVLIGAGAAGVLAGLGWIGATAVTSKDPKDAPLALVYRGPASRRGCPEAVAALLRSTATGFRIEFCGPEEERQVSASTLAEAAVYAQPGGGSLDPAWRRLRGHASDIRDFVHGGGRYLGFCLGGYLAGATPGFELLPGDTDQYIGSPGASVDDEHDTTVPVRWRGRPRTMYFQDGPVFRLRPGATATVLAVYDTGAPAAVLARFGAGCVGVVGPHPEAADSWYASANLPRPDPFNFDLGHDLIESTVQGDAPVELTGD